jgi:hypothetical protein
MNIFFSKTNPAEIVADINAVLSGRKLGDLVSIEHSGDEITVVIAKAGTSKISFKAEKKPDGLTLKKSGEKIAFTHKLFKDEVTEKFLQVVEKAGGKVVA